MHGPPFSIFMPFLGGSRFITLQLVGWSLFTFSLLALAMCLYVGATAISTAGFLPGLAICSCISHAVLATSLFYFDPQQAVVITADSTPGTAPHASSDQSNEPRRLWALSTLLALSQCLLFVFADLGLLVFGPSFPALPLVAAASLVLLGAAPLAFWRLRICSANTLNQMAEQPTLSRMQLLGLTLWSFAAALVLSHLVSSCAWSLAGCTLSVELAKLLHNASPNDSFVNTSATVGWENTSTSHSGLLAYSGVTGLAAQLLVMPTPSIPGAAGAMASVFMQLRTGQTGEGVPRADRPMRLWRRALQLSMILIFYNAHNVVIATYMLLLYVSMHLPLVVACVLILVGALYPRTYLGSPASTGHRRWGSVGGAP